MDRVCCDVVSQVVYVKFERKLLAVASFVGLRSILSVVAIIRMYVLVHTLLCIIECKYVTLCYDAARN